MSAPEYFSLFSESGEFSVEVKFLGEGFVAPRCSTAHDISRLINPKTGRFYVAMTFDDHLFEIYKYEIDPINKKLIICARQHG